MNKLTLNLYLYTRYAPPAAIAKPIKITQTAVQADLPVLDALPANRDGTLVKANTTPSPPPPPPNSLHPKYKLL